MRMTDDDYGLLREAVLAVATPEKVRAYKDAGLSDERFRWDAFHACGLDIRPLYRYLHDSHVDTALRKIMREIGASGV